MSDIKNKPPGDKTPKPATPAAASSGKAAPSPVIAAVKAKIPPMFRRVDWLTFFLTAGVIWIIYVITLAPELTLEDSGELCTGSFYAGIPHPPGYPVWTLYTWLFTVIVPFGNIAWRVALAEATAGAVACGLVAMMVSRGSSMLMEGIADLKTMTGKWEKAICLVAGVVAGLVFGLDTFMWKESVVVNRVCVFSVPWFLAMLLLVMRWMYAPQQYRYLYWAFFMYGLSITTHQSLLVASLGLEIVIAASKPRLGRDMFFWNSIVWVVIHLIHIFTGNWVFANLNGQMFSFLFNSVGVCSLIACVALTFITKEFFSEILPTLLMGLLFAVGFAFYLYLPISGMTNPPMQWGYPRTVDGFLHALSRGQYQQPDPTNIFLEGGIVRLFKQVGYLVTGLAEEYTWVYLFIALVPFVVFFKMRRRERVWILGLAAFYLCNGVLLMMLMNPSPERASVDLVKVFFISSHAIVAVLVGYGLALIAAFMATHYEKFRVWGMAGGGVAALLAIWSLIDATRKHFGGRDGIGVPFAEVGHWIGQAFSPNTFGMPVFASLFLLAMPFIFIAALLLYRNRAPLVIAFGLFAIMPLHAGLSHWHKSEQRDHWFGYWFGHDMFTPPFGIYPEMTRDAVLYGGTDPGRFCPTYMIFCESFIPDKDKPKEDQKFDRRDVYIITQNALADGTYLEYIRAHYNRSKQIDPPFFQNAVQRVLDFGKSKDRLEEDRLNNNQHTNILARIAYQLLDRPFIARGERIEARRRAEHVYPAKEIYIASDRDSAECFNTFYTDAKLRKEHDLLHPNEPPQVRPGEEINLDQARGTISVGGNTAVMSINGLITKVIFDNNPTNEFFLEESFPLDWMYPYLSPFGIIMKINREKLPEITEEMVKKDHAFWSEYSTRFIGNWITYDTKVSEIADFVQRVHLRHDFTGFKGDRRFIRDEDGQKAFSKLRSSIAASVYDWRFRNARTQPERDRMMKETDFAYRQAVAFCPFSPEAVFHYVKFLADVGRIDDAIIVAETCFKLDPDNSAVENLVNNLRDFKKRGMGVGTSQIDKLEKDYHDNPANVQTAFSLMGAYMQMQQPGKALAIAEAMEKQVQENPTNTQLTFSLMGAYSQMQQPGRALAMADRLEKEIHDHPTNTQLALALIMNYQQMQQPARAVALADQMLANPGADEETIVNLAKFYAQTSNYAKLEAALEVLTRHSPSVPESWYDLAGLKMMLGKTNEVVPNLKRALQENAKRLAANPAALNVETRIRADERFKSLQSMPEFQKLFSAK